MSSTQMDTSADESFEEVEAERDDASSSGASIWLVAVCMIVISASLAVVLYLELGFTAAEAGWAGFGLLLSMVLAEFFASRVRDRAAVEAELQAINELAVELSREVSSVKLGLAELKASVNRRVEDVVDARIGAVTADIQLLDDRLAEIAAAQAEPKRGKARRKPVAEEMPEQEEAVAEASGPLAGLPAKQALQMIRGAVENNRIDIFLQPVVSLPQRKVRYYEALTRLRAEDGETIMPGAYIPVAEPAGIMPLIDNILLFRAVQIVRKMTRRNKEMAIFCNMSARSLVDEEFFPQFMEFMTENRELSESLIFEFSQDVLDNLGPMEQAGLDALADLGFRFSIDNVTNLDIDGKVYAERKVKFVKIDAETLRNPPESAQVHIADLGKLLARSGIVMIASRIESESELLELLDFDVALGQGHLFSPPRPVRNDVVGEAADAAEWAKAS